MEEFLLGLTSIILLIQTIRVSILEEKIEELEKKTLKSLVV